MIARDRGKKLAECLANVRPFVDEIIVVDAGGSTDDTLDVAQRFGAKTFDFTPATHPEAFYLDTEERFAPHGIPGPFTGTFGLADFSAARNFSFSKCTGDLILWLDSDDTVRNAEKIRWMAERFLENPDADTAFLGYEYDHDEEGHCIIRQVRERLIRRTDFESGKVTWKLPIHETLDGLKKGLLFDDLIVVHDSPVLESVTINHGNLNIQTNHRDAIHFRNMKNLVVEKERAEAAGESMPWRLYYYLGTEFRSIDPERAVGYFNEYLKVGPWAEERAMARYYVGQIREMQSRHEESWDVYAGACMEFPGNPAPWFGLARLAFIKGEWNQVVDFSEKGFEQVREDIAKKPSLVLNPLEWRYRAHLPYSRALIEVGRIEDAKKSCDTGLKVNPACFYLNIHSKMIAERLHPSEAEKAA